MAAHLAIAGDVLDGALFCAVLFPKTWMRSGTELSQFLRIVLPIFYIKFLTKQHKTRRLV